MLFDWFQHPRKARSRHKLRTGIEIERFRANRPHHKIACWAGQFGISYFRAKLCSSAHAVMAMVRRRTSAARSGGNRARLHRASRGTKGSQHQTQRQQKRGGSRNQRSYSSKYERMQHSLTLRCPACTVKSIVASSLLDGPNRRGLRRSSKLFRQTSDIRKRNRPSPESCQSTTKSARSSAHIRRPWRFVP